MAAPVHTRAAHYFAGQERTEAAHRQRLLRHVVADGQRVLRGVLHQVVAHHIAQLVANVRHLIVARGAAAATALQRQHFQSGFSQFFRENAASPAQTDQDDIDFLQFFRHGISP